MAKVYLNDVEMDGTVKMRLNGAGNYVIDTVALSAMPPPAKPQPPTEAKPPEAKPPAPPAK